MGKGAHSYGILKVYFSIYKSQQPHGSLLKGQEKKVRVGERSIAASVVIWTMATAGLIISCNVALITSQKKKKWIFQQEPFWAFLYSSPNRKNNHLLKQNRGEKTILIYRFSFISIQIKKKKNTFMIGLDEAIQEESSQGKMEGANNSTRPRDSEPMMMERLQNWRRKVEADSLSYLMLWAPMSRSI